MRISDWSSDVCSTDLDTSVSGTMMHSTARQLRKVSQHSSVMAPKMAANICTSACSTASFVAAATPALPPARRKRRLGVLSAVRQSVGQGKSGHERGGLGGRRRSKKNKPQIE